jgi:hypothetical protein
VVLADILFSGLCLAQRLRGALVRHRLPADPDTLTVMIQGSHVKVAFAMPGGAVGAG